MNFPEDLKYTKDHEWVKLDGDVATVGITDFAQSELGDIVYVEVDTVGDELDREGIFGTIEAVKTVSDLFSPITGEVLEFNEVIDDAPETVNSDPYGAGWVAKIKVADASELDTLLDVNTYKELIGQ